MQLTKCLSMFFAIFFTVAFGVLSAATSAEISVELIAVGRHPAPGTEPGTIYGRGGIQRPTINSRGRVAFLSDLAGPAIGDRIDMGIWVETPAGLQLVARSGDLAFAEDGAEFDVFSANRSTIFTESGHVIFAPDLRGDGVDHSNDHAIFRSTVGHHEPIARRGSEAPGSKDGAVFSYLIDHVANVAGDVAFHALLANGAGQTVGHGIWHAPADSPAQLVAREGMRVPNRRFNGVFSALEVPRLNDSGELAFWARAHGPRVANGQGIWSGAPGDVSPVAHEGTQAPGTDSGVHFGSFTNPGFNDRGEVSFRAGLRGLGVSDENNEGVWAGGRGSLALVARKGESAPGLETGQFFGRLPFRVPLNAQGDVTFFAEIDGAGVDETNDVGLWAGTPGDVRLIARKGDRAPGTEPGAVFEDFNHIFSDPAINDQGLVAFVANLAGPNINGLNSAGVWATTGDGRLHLVARERDCFDIGGVFGRRCIDGIELGGGALQGGGGQDGRPLRFDAAGRLIFTGNLGGDLQSGVFIATIPEPASAGLCLLGMIAQFVICSRRRFESHTDSAM